ncbi:MAG: non-heme iron oxygenase ferredoxin subunit [Acidimicrobiales bacterium]|jgi:3-phenylpropionate/trans-cinnamate dioxygenase ferredoxin subunit|nr:non-heme iron oxygenase ferredoxin subunit [Acidimicrobiales bacterium]MCH2413052.1 non-heme iron oxygenase ferredoxin subunit [Acidimicrobiales bacterium]MED5584575.1 non-heme iron oxygenase ferredoxin subunit [Actinomycetota bacterium]|tara:strand:- start:575 stop:901 length:327 start_codon:yes stop_codon:yes gene_type:complete
MSEVRACALSELADAVAHQVDVGGCPVALVRLGDTVHAIGDTCSHAEVSLAEGIVDTDECALECWKHGSLFSLESGEALTLPATRPVPIYVVRVDGDDVFVDLPGEER